MDSIGQTLGWVLQRAQGTAASQATRLRTLARPAKRDANGLPIRFDREVDLEIPRRLICWRPEHGQVGIRRELSAPEKAAIESRTAALELALQPFDEDEGDVLKASIGAMFNGFRSMRQQGEDIDATVAVTLAVLREFPAWAITAACLAIARRETRFTNPHYAPNDAEITEVVRETVASYRRAFNDASALLTAVVQTGATPTRGSTREASQPAPISHGDGKHGQRVMADIAARKARQVQSGESTQEIEAP